VDSAISFDDIATENDIVERGWTASRLQQTLGAIPRLPKRLSNKFGYQLIAAHLMLHGVQRNTDFEHLRYLLAISSSVADKDDDD
jgi:hypothetical protein